MKKILMKKTAMETKEKNQILFNALYKYLLSLIHFKTFLSAIGFGSDKIMRSHDGISVNNHMNY